MDELEQIQQQIAELQKKAQIIQQEKKAEVIREVKAKISSYGLTARDLGFSEVEKAEGKKRSSVAIKYRLGDETWTGRGRKPKWLEAYLNDGGDLSALAV